MEDVVDPALIYELADTLQITIKQKRTAPKLSGEGKMERDFGGLKVSSKVKIVSSAVGRNGVMILARLQGNLVVFVEATAKEQAKVRLFLLNLAKMAQPEDFLETTQPANADVVEKLMGKAVVGKFVRIGNAAWQKAA